MNLNERIFGFILLSILFIPIGYLLIIGNIDVIIIILLYLIMLLLQQTLFEKFKWNLNN